MEIIQKLQKSSVGLVIAKIKEFFRKKTFEERAEKKRLAAFKHGELQKSWQKSREENLIKAALHYQGHLLDCLKNYRVLVGLPRKEIGDNVFHIPITNLVDEKLSFNIHVAEWGEFFIFDRGQFDNAIYSPSTCKDEAVKPSHYIGMGNLENRLIRMIELGMIKRK